MPETDQRECLRGSRDTHPETLDCCCCPRGKVYFAIYISSACGRPAPAPAASILDFYLSRLRSLLPVLAAFVCVCCFLLCPSFSVFPLPRTCFLFVASCLFVSWLKNKLYGGWSSVGVPAAVLPASRRLGPRRGLREQRWRLR